MVDAAVILAFVVLACDLAVILVGLLERCLKKDEPENRDINLVVIGSVQDEQGNKSVSLVVVQSAN